MDNNSTTHITLNEFKSSVSIALKVNSKRDEMKLIIIKHVEILQNHDALNCIIKLNTTITQELFSYFVYDCMVLHNFQTYNRRKDLDFSNETINNGTKLQFVFIIKKKSCHPINMTWRQYNMRLGNYQ